MGSANGSTSSVWDWDWELCPTARMVGASDVDPCIGSDTGNLEREVVVRAGGGDGKGGGVSALDWVSWKRVLPDSPLVPLCPETGLNLGGRSIGLELGPASTSGSGWGTVGGDLCRSGVPCLDRRFDHPSRPSRLGDSVEGEGTSRASALSISSTRIL